MSENHESWHGLMTWHQHVVVIFCPICEGAQINNQQSHFGTNVVTLQIRNTSIIETVVVLLTNYVPPRVPFFIG